MNEEDWWYYIILTITTMTVLLIRLQLLNKSKKTVASPEINLTTIKVEKKHLSMEQNMTRALFNIQIPETP